MERIDSYSEALYHVKRGFLIVGLTGFTGSGCSTVRSILESEKKPKTPGYNVISTFQSSQSQRNHTHKEIRKNAKSDRDRRIYEKLARTWQGLLWEPFVPVKVSTVIFTSAIACALNGKVKGNDLKGIQPTIRAKESKLKAISGLWAADKPDDDMSWELVDAYETADALYDQFKGGFHCRLGEFTKLMQDFGDQIRSYGTVEPGSAARADPANLFVLPEALRRIIKAYRNAKQASHFVVDAFRNPFEIEFFKWRYSEFYLLAVLRNKKDRWEDLDLLKDEKERLEARESKTRNRTKENITEWIISQDIEECLTKADIYVENPRDETGEYPYLKFNLLKLISLAKSPGCIPPTKDERSMQIAMTARQMSGCISRRVGAVVVNQEGYLAGFGWNDPPRGQPPCSLRTAKELLENPSQPIFSKFEMRKEFRELVRRTCDVNQPFCFRHEFITLTNKTDGEREHTRALHAEENALFQALKGAGDNLEGATLYTTDQPCTLCAKKAYHLGIDRIVYIQDYPDIAVAQTLEAGTRRVEVQRFQGVTGSAYFKLFSSLMPEKDIIQLYD